MGLLETLRSPADLKKLTLSELESLAAEIRQTVIGTVEKNGGHLSPNLGMVELTIALYYAFDFPSDKLLFDVGHQAYAHKILSDRADRFGTLRKKGGISGFPVREESPYDAFSAGHAGNSLAASLGIAKARDARGETFRIVDVIGDGSLVNGVSLEALTATEKKPDRFIVVLNDNGMSISENNNGFYKALSKVTTGKRYRTAKRRLKSALGQSFLGRGLKACKSLIKRMLNRHVYLEDFGLKYVGVLDGHNLRELIKVFCNVRDSEQAVFVHVRTVKGKGLKPAEEKSDYYHGLSTHFESSENAFSSRLGETLCALAEQDEGIFAITAGMKDGTGLTAFGRRFPERLTDVGICEEYAVTYAAGLAAAGAKPVVCIYSTFLQRAYDQILHDVCIQNLPVVFCVDRAGVVGADGKTHQGVFDLSYLSHLPNMEVLAPSSLSQFDGMLSYALSAQKPVAIRYPNGKEREGTYAHAYRPGAWDTVKEGKDVAILAVGGRMLALALQAAERTEKSVRVIDAHSVKPLDIALLDELRELPLITLEDNALIGGFYSAVASRYAAAGRALPVVGMGIGDAFVPHASVSEQLEMNGLTAERILKEIENL